jgi:predicted permease
MRQLKRAPGFGLAIVLTLALGIGANTAIFSFVHALLVRPFPFPDPDRLVEVHAWNGSDKGRLSLQEAADLNERARLFEGFAAYRDSGYNYGGDYSGGDGGPAEHIVITMATSNLFRVLGAEPAVGTTWPVVDDRSRCFDIVLTNDLWKRRFRSDPNIIGKQVLMDGFPNTVTGVAAPGITFPHREGLFRWGISSNPQSYAERHRRNAWVVGRLRRSMTIEQGRAEVAAIGERLAAEFPATNSRTEYRMSSLRDAYMGDVKPYLLVLLGAVGLLLLVACANVANLLLARVAGRQREMAIRAALGAGRGELIRQSLGESLVYSSLGGAIGVSLAYLTLPILARLVTVELPSWMAVRVDGSVLLFAVSVVLLTSLLAGLLPAIRGAREELQQLLKQGAAGSTRPGRALGPLVTAEVAIASVLLIGAGLMLQSLSHLMRVDLGFRTDRTFTFAMGLSWRKYNYERANDLQTRVLERLRQIPGVTGAAMDTMLPLTGRGQETTIQLEGQAALQEPAAAPLAGLHQVSTNYHQMMGIRLFEGRFFQDLDHQTAPKVALVSRKPARRLSPHRSIVGMRVFPRDRFGPGAQEWLTVAGVVDDVKHSGPAGEPAMDLYVPYLQTGSQGSHFVVRTDLPAEIIHKEALRAVASVDPGEPPNDMLMMDQILSRTIWQRQLAGVVFAILASLGLSLAGVGIYGVIAYSVSQRVREIGIRSALGARRGDILRMVLSEGARFAVPGMVVGIAVGWLLGRALQSLLFQISPHDPITLGAVVAVEGIIACGACLVPAARAARMDPLRALRSE